ncbi:MAG: hypothetical protein KC413_09625, partial [Anaerolineales bacterium]|nr:hypothetical protein [Anaerolineales bacterium]
AQLLRRHGVCRVVDVGGNGRCHLEALPQWSQLTYEMVMPDEIWSHSRGNGDMMSPAPDLVICVDVLSDLYDVQHEHVVRALFNYGARAVLLTCTVTRLLDFWDCAQRLQIGYRSKMERLYRTHEERVIAFDLCEPCYRGQPTEIAYVCTSDRQAQLFTSLRSLLQSGTIFDRVVIFLLDKRPSHWHFADPRIVVQEVSPLIGDFFFSNKARVCDRAAARVIHMDTDTLILRPLDLIWENHTEDVLARPASVFGSGEWDGQIWADTLARVGAADVPMFNTGFLVFQNGAHHQLQKHWLQFIRHYMGGELSTPGKMPRMFGQLAVSLAVGVAHLPYHTMSAAEHGFAWLNDSFASAFVFHTGNWLFETYAHEVSSGLVINAGVGVPDPYKRIPQPNNDLWHRGRRFFRRRVTQVKELIPAWASPG